MRAHRSGVVVACAFFVLALGTSAAEAQQRGPTIADVTEKALPSVVNISSKRAVKSPVSQIFSDPFFGKPRARQAHSLGSGVILSKRGYVLTNNHVVANATQVKVALANGREFKARLIGADPKSDLAVLKIERPPSNLQPIEIGDSRKLRLGETVLAIGNPFGVGQTVTKGIVSAKGRGNMGMVDYEDFIQTDAAINPGNSGGALINRQGQLIGINTAILSRTGGSQGIGFAIPTSMVKPIMKMLIADGRVSRGWLGIGIQKLNRELAQTLGIRGATRGVLVTDVTKKSPAASAGLRRDDVIVKIGGRRTLTPRALRIAVANAGAHKTIGVTLIRNGDSKALSVKLGEIPKQTAQATPPAAKGTKTKLGLHVRPVDRAMRKKYRLPQNLTDGVVVTHVEQGSVTSGYLRPGDVIFEVNRKAVRSAKQLGKSWRESRRVAFRIYRDGATIYLMLSR